MDSNFGNYPGRFLNLLFLGETTFCTSIHNTFLEPEVQNLWHVMIGFENKISFNFVKHPGRLGPIFCWKSTLPPLLLKLKVPCHLYYWNQKYLATYITETKSTLPPLLLKPKVPYHLYYWN